MTLEMPRPLLKDAKVLVCGIANENSIAYGCLLLNEAAQRAPLGELVDIMDVGYTCAFLATPYARRLSGETLYIDGGVNIMA
jgi:enoyl-[acyl-carrier-protein] reductase (NADH)